MLNYNSSTIFNTCLDILSLKFSFGLFCIFSILAVFSAFMVIFSRNPIHSIFFLILSFVCVSVLLFTLQLEFLPLIFLIIYVGAISVLFLFVVMMLNINIIELSEKFFNYLPIGAFMCLVFLIELYIFILSDLSFIESPFSNFFIYKDLDINIKLNLWEIFTEYENLMVLTYKILVEDPSQFTWNLQKQDNLNLILIDEPVLLSWFYETDIVFNNVNWFNGYNNLLAMVQHQYVDIMQIAEVLYEDMFFSFILSSIVLLIAMLGSIILTLPKERNLKTYKRQDISNQVYRSIFLKTHINNV